jgi:hypothetical protein
MGARRRALVRLVLPAFTALAMSATALVTGALGGTTPPAAAVTGSPAATAVRYALSQLGDPYRYGAAGTTAWDCSGLTMRAFGAAGVALPHSSRAQYGYGTRVAEKYWRPGDLIFWSSNGAASGIYHVGIYVGGRRVLHAPSPGRVVQIEPMWSHGLLPYGRRIAAWATPLLTVTSTVSGDRVKAVQQRLRAQGYSSIAVTGRFDAATLVATKRFQARLGQRADGQVTWSTWAGLVDHGVVARIS